jgi:ribosomal protein S18 acetylase RimI-like enzyme
MRAPVGGGLLKGLPHVTHSCDARHITRSFQTGIDSLLLVKQLELEVLSEDEWKVWRELRLAALTESPAAFGSTLADWSGAGDTQVRWRERLRIPGSRNVVAYRNEVPVGMLTTTPDIELEARAWLMSMWVDPDYRGTGIARSLINDGMSWAKSTGRQSLHLMVRQQNESAIDLYVRCGFSATGFIEVERDSNGVDWTEIEMSRAIPGVATR